MTYDDWKTTEPVYADELRLCLLCRQPIDIDDIVVADCHAECLEDEDGIDGVADLAWAWAMREDRWLGAQKPNW